jgi:hypothetical protein
MAFAEPESGECRSSRHTNPDGGEAMKFVRPLLLTILLIGGASLAVAQD